MRDSGFGMGKDARAALRFSRTRPSGIRPGVDARPSRRSAFPNPESRIPAFNSRTAGHPRPMRQAHFVARHKRDWMEFERGLDASPDRKSVVAGRRVQEGAIPGG